MTHKPTYIIGTHSGHDASACLLKDNELLYAITKERLTRKKHDSGEPTECINYLLDAAQLKKEEIDLVIRTNWFDSTELNDKYYENFPKVISSRRHHEFHAWNTTTVLKDTPTLILITDGRGCRPEDLEDDSNIIPTDSHLQQFEVESVYLYDGEKMSCLEKRWGTYEKNKYSWGSHIVSLGYAYAAVSKTIFGSSNAAGKVMALAALGAKNHTIPSPLIYHEDFFEINEEWLHFIEAQSKPIQWDSATAKDLAFSIQKALEEYLTFRVKQLIEKYGVRSISLGGGVALNCKANGLLAKLDGVQNVSVFNASGDDGLSLGAAIWAKHVLYKNKETLQWNVGTGRSYTIEESGTSLGIHFGEVIAKLLVENKLVGLFNGGSEFGPRALGNRSILASPLDANMKDYLNQEVKERETFRPFGCAILKKDLESVTDDPLASIHMLSAFHIKEHWKEKYPAILHVDDTTRIQVIEDETSPFGKILAAFTAQTGCPFLINTSFNGRGEPIVETVEDATRCAENIGLDYVVIEKELMKVSKV
ncbi:carbamoyltransferase C-terminal domain-containing protein [Evansella sp. AB-P1]|uniref:carbamoyltransferase C-terminal domain-containing protein n=1 Tax=Evansella sp. AB-P1 TaxID=3037653 RepID=UPI00241F0C14|nr:carbamoyltransferase C-terminal domain-containing protein [Evansella sp. AB-P1]MDG5788353.1 carbamoyltransferase C-terminal domain-containing protein [Evansella sp. AB-P1]